MSKGNAYTMLNRMKRSLEEAISSYLLMRRGSKNCEMLQRIVAPFVIPPVTQDMRRTVERHVRKCDVCTETRRTLMAPLAVFGAFAAVPAPAGLRERIWADLSTQWARVGPPSYEACGAKKGSQLGKGSSLLERGPFATAWGGRRLAVVLGAVLVVAIVPVLVVLSIELPGGGQAVSRATATPTSRPATITRAPTRTPTVAGTKGPTATPSAGPTATAGAVVHTSTPLPPAGKTPTPAATTTAATATPYVRPSPTVRPTRTRFPTETPRPTRTPEPTIPRLN